MCLSQLMEWSVLNTSALNVSKAIGVFDVKVITSFQYNNLILHAYAALMK